MENKLALSLFACVGFVFVETAGGLGSTSSLVMRGSGCGRGGESETVVCSPDALCTDGYVGLEHEVWSFCELGRGWVEWRIGGLSL